MATFILSTLDQGAPWTYLRYALTFACTVEQSETTIENLNRAVKSLVSEIPMLAGNLAINDEHKSAIAVTLQQIDSFAATINHHQNNTQSYAAICRQGVSPKHISGVDFTPLANDPDSDSSPCCAIQANFIDGGLALVIYLHHAVADIRGVATILRLMSEGLPVRTLDQEALELEATTVTQARARLSDGSGAPAFLDIERRQQHSIKHERQLDGENNILPISDNNNNIEMHSTRAAILSFKLNIIEQTAEMINSRRSLRDRSATDDITPRDVLIAIIWRAYTRAKWPAVSDAEATTQTSVSFPIDLRSYLLPPLDTNWMGNVELTATASEAILRLAMSYDLSTLEHTAGIIRAAATAAVSDLLVRSRISLINAESSQEEIPPAHLIVHDWTPVPKMEQQEMDLSLGLGRPDAIRRTGRSFAANEVVLLPENQQARTWEVQVELEQSFMIRLLRDDLLRAFVWHVAR